MIRIITYWYNFVKESILIYKYRKAALSIEKDLEAEGLRVDYLGRIYTVINLPEEVLGQQELLQQSYVLSQLTPITNILLKYGLADSSFPEIIKVEGTASYLIILYPERDYVDGEVFLVNSLITAVVGVVIWAAVKWVPWLWVSNSIQSLYALLPKE